MKHQIIADSLKQIEAAVRNISDVYDQELEAFGNLSERGQESERGVQRQEDLTAFEEVLDLFSEAQAAAYRLIRRYRQPPTA